MAKDSKRTTMNLHRLTHFQSLILMAVCMVANGAFGDDYVIRFDSPRLEKPEWNVAQGNWEVEDGQLIANSLNGESYILFGDPSWSNYDVRVKLTFREVRTRSRWASIIVRAPKTGEPPWSQVPVRFESTAKNGIEFAVKKKKGWSVRSTSSAKANSTLNVARDLRVIVKGPRVVGYLDGELIIDSQYCVDRSRGCIGLAASGCIVAFDDLTLRRLPDTPNSARPAPCECVAHRGFSARAPENTLTAIREAIKSGASGCEFDVHGSKDGHVVLMHDKTVDRTTNGSGAVKDLTIEQLRKLDAGSWKGAKYAGEPVPTLIEALQLLKGRRCQPIIEIKSKGIAEQVVSDVRKLGMEGQVAVIAFDKTVVRRVRRLAPRISCAWLSGDQVPGSPQRQADVLARQAQECETNILDLSFKLLSPELVAELKRRNLKVWTWTVDEPSVMTALRQWGVDSITTNRPDLLVQQLRSHK